MRGSPPTFPEPTTAAVEEHGAHQVPQRDAERQRQAILDAALEQRRAAQRLRKKVGVLEVGASWDRRTCTASAVSLHVPPPMLDALASVESSIVRMRGPSWLSP